MGHYIQSPRLTQASGCITGEVYTCGLNSRGQCGVGATSNTPEMNRIQKVEAVASKQVLWQGNYTRTATFCG
jgi:hypothetical protein